MASSNGDEIIGENKVKRKSGSINEEQYKRNVIKKARLCGQSYTSHSGKLVPKVEIGPDCKCKKKCFPRISEMERITIFYLFWDLESKNVQDIHLQNHITMEDVKRRTSKDEDGNTFDKRSVSFRYYVKLSGSLTEVCKVAFCNIYGVTPDRVRRLCNHLKVNKLPEDLRGRAPAKNAISGETCKLIEEHIQSFPQKTHIIPKEKLATSQLT
ncbi:hypothetical protein C0J52_14045 [Blattella germanica]|nr:hypothetical protein C0J52_14045 [Blattella germanica]